MTKARDLASNSTGSKPTLIDAKGDLLVGTAADTAGRLAVGTNGYTLVADSAETTGLKWAAPAAGGKVLQVVNTILTAGSFSTTSSSYVDVTNANVTITPATTGSRIMIFCSTVGGAYAASGSGNCDLRLAIVRTSTIVNEYRFDLENNTGSSTSLNTIITPYYLDSPSTTSATTYKIQIKKVNFSDSVQVTANTTNKFILTAMEIGA